MAQNEVPEVYTLSELSKKTGVTYSSLRRWCLEGCLSYVRAGKKYYVNWDSYVAFVNGKATRGKVN